MNWGKDVFRVVAFDKEKNTHFFRLFLPLAKAQRIVWEEQGKYERVWIEKLETGRWREYSE